MRLGAHPVTHENPGPFFGIVLFWEAAVPANFIGASDRKPETETSTAECRTVECRIMKFWPTSAVLHWTFCILHLPFPVSGFPLGMAGTRMHRPKGPPAASQG